MLAPCGFTGFRILEPNDSGCWRYREIGKMALWIQKFRMLAWEIHRSQAVALGIQRIQAVGSWKRCNYWAYKKTVLIQGK